MKQAEAQQLSQMKQDIGRALTHDEEMEFSSYRLGMMLHTVVLAFWNNSDVIRQLNTKPQTNEARDPLPRPAPYCKKSKKDEGVWNFFWKAPIDELFKEPTRASMFYTIHPDGQVVCREHPNDQLNIDNLNGMLNLAVVIVSDCLEIPVARLDTQATAEKVAKQLWGVTL